MASDFNPGQHRPAPESTAAGHQTVASPTPLARPQQRSSAGRLGLALAAVAFMMIFGVAAFGAGIVFERQVLADDDPSSNAPVAVFNRAWDIVQENYVVEEAIDEDRMLEGAIEGMLATLGDEGHTRYLTAEETALDRQSSRGVYYGVGIEVREVEGQGLVVMRTFPTSSAEEEGVQRDDVIVAVDGENVTNTPTDEIVRRIRGPEGTRVQLTVFRPSANQEISFDLERREIKVSAVSWGMLENNIALLRLDQFSDRSGEDMAAALQAALDQGAQGVILDLRGNPGGLVREAREVASLFVPDDAPIFISRTRDGGEEVHRAERGDVYLDEDIPLVVLIDHTSASASEIVSGSIQSQAPNGTLVGETTVGTGTVLRQFELGDGSTIWLGVELWLTPEGQMIRGEGITPDIVVPLAEDQIPFVPDDDLPPPPVSEINDDQIEFAFDLLTGSSAQSSFPVPSGAGQPW